jgi:hypothetical protein
VDTKKITSEESFAGVFSVLACGVNKIDLALVAEVRLTKLERLVSRNDES